MPVMEVRIVRMAMDEPGMPMGMSVGLRRHSRRMRMLVMVIVYVDMVMHHRLVHMLMLVLLRQVEPQADGHENAARDEGRGDRLVQEQNGGASADERSQRIVGSRSRRPEMPQCQNEQRQ